MTESRIFSSVYSEDMPDDSEARDNKDIYFRVAKKSEQVLKENRIPPPSGVKESSIYVSIGQQHRDATG